MPDPVTITTVALAALAPAKIVECCIGGILGNRADAALARMGSSIYQLTGKSEHKTILAAMHRAFSGSIKAVEKACASAGANTADQFSHRALQEFVASGVLDKVQMDVFATPVELLEAQVRTIYGRQGKTPQAIATDTVIGLLESAINTALTPAMRTVFHEGAGKGKGRCEGWAREFENLFSQEVQEKEALFRILMLDRMNEVAAGTIDANAKLDLLLRRDAHALLDDMEKGTAEPEVQARFERIKAAHDSSSPSVSEEQVAEAAIIQTELARSNDPVRQDASKLFDAGRPLEAAALIDASIEARQAEDRKNDAADYRKLAIATLPASIAAAIGYYTRATDLDPTDFVTWIELSRLYRDAGSLPSARRTAEWAAQHIGGDWDRIAAEEALGDIALDEGRLTTARRHYEARLDAAQNVLASDEANPNYQREVSVSHSRLGDVAEASGDLVEAKAHYGKALAIREPLAASDLGKAVWQRDLSVSHNKLGDVAKTSGDLMEAKEQYGKALAIRLQLAASDVGNTGWQRDLSVSHEKSGDVAVGSGDLAEAKVHFGKALAIRESLAASDVDNAVWQRDLSISHEKLGDIAEAMGDREEAVRRYEASLPIAEALVRDHPDYPLFTKDLAITQRRLAALRGAG